MVRALRARGANVGWYLPDRLEDGYGLSLETVRRLAARGTRLLITVDCGITAVDEVAAARAAGLDVVVCDHHAPRADGRLPDCEIVHPGGLRVSVPGPVRDRGGLQARAGARSAGRRGRLELVALATVADLMPLGGRTAGWCGRGWGRCRGPRRPGLRALMTVAKADPSALDTHALAFRLAPRINAAGRLRRADAGLELLLTGDEGRAAEIASELDRVNAERRAVEQRIVWEAEAQVAELGERRAYVLAGEGWHPGVVGIVASRVVERHHRPAVVVALDGEVGTGSGRSIPGFDLLGALHASAEHLERYGGHRAAAGMTIRRDRLEPVPRRVRAPRRGGADPRAAGAARARRRDRLGMRARPRAGRGARAAGAVRHGQPPAPAARARRPAARPAADGGGAPPALLVGSGGISARAVAFGCGGRLGVEAEEPVDATFRLERNFWNGAVEPRLVLGHARPCAPEPIEVLGEPGDYLGAVLAELDRASDAPEPPAAGRGGEARPSDRERFCWTAAATARWRCSATRSRSAARCWPCAPTSPAGWAVWPPGPADLR